jgi:hypothetical protein
LQGEKGNERLAFGFNLLIMKSVFYGYTKENPTDCSARKRNTLKAPSALVSYETALL